jgi:ubiquinone biosynthesis protein
VPAYKHVERYRQIASILIDEGFESWLDLTGLRRFAPVRSRFHREGPEPDSMGVRVRRTLERLGPTFVKLGQAASTRSDVIPESVILELRKLQDEVAPFSAEQVRAIVTEELGGTPEEVFAAFDPVPFASASIGQVHAATLPDGTAVAVKVQRPGVRRQVETDVDILLTQARFVRDHTDLGADYDVVDISQGFADAVRGELNYVTEATNAERLARMFAEDDTVAFPAIFWEFTTERVLTMERFEGAPFNRPDLLDASGADRAELAKRGIYCYLEQIFAHGFYHADPHPGNLFALADGRVAFTDFGRVGSISQVGREQLADLFLAIIENDVQLAVDMLVAAAGSPGDLSVADLEREVSQLINKYYNRALREVHIGELISEVLALVRNNRLSMSSELAVLLATLAVLEGLGTQLDPAFDFVEVTAPFARRLADSRFQPQTMFRTATRSLRRSVRVLSELPDSLSRFLKRAGQGEFRVTVRPTGMDPLLARFEEAVNRLSFALVVAAFVIGLSWLLAGTELPMAFIWIARFALAGAVAVGSWFFISAIIAHYDRRRRH